MSAAEVFDATRAKATAAGRVLAKIFKFVAIAATWGAGGAAALTAVTADGDFTHRFFTVLSLLDFSIRSAVRRPNSSGPARSCWPDARSRSSRGQRW